MKSVYIELTDEQIKKLLPLFDEVEKHSDTDPVMLLAQISATNSAAVAFCRIVDHEKSLKIQAVFGKKYIGEQIGYDQTKRALAKARGE